MSAAEKSLKRQTRLGAGPWRGTGEAGGECWGRQTGVTSTLGVDET